MLTFNRELADHAWRKLDARRRLHHVMRKHLKHAGIGDHYYRRLQHGDYSEREAERWLVDVSIMFEALNFLIETPPAQTSIKRGAALTWEEMFGSAAVFPPAPAPYRRRPGMDAGSAELGLSWDRAGVVAYEQQLQSEKSRHEALGDASKLRQVIEKLATINESIANWEGAIRYLHELRSINLKFQDEVFVADCLLRLGIAYYRLGCWPQAEEVINQGLAIVQRRPAILSGSKTELRLRGYCGLLKLRNNEAQEALRIFNDDVQRLVNHHRSTYVTGTFHHRRALIYESLGRYSDAHHDIDLALKFRIACNAEFEVSRTLFYLGRICGRQGHKRAAVAIWTVCEQRHLRLQDSLGLARVNLELGNACVTFAGDGGDSDVVCDLLEADLTAGELTAVRVLAKSFHADAEGGLRTVIPRQEMIQRAMHHYASAVYWSEAAVDADLCARARTCYDELLETKRAAAARAGRPHDTSTHRR